MNKNNEPKAAQGASVAKTEEKAVLTVSSRKAQEKSLDSVFSKLAELKKAELVHANICAKISELQELVFEEGSRAQSLTIIDVQGRNFTVYAEGFLTSVVAMLLKEANNRKQDAEQYLLTATI